MNVSNETRRTVKWILVGLLALQLLIVPWKAPVQIHNERIEYAPIFAPPNIRWDVVERSATLAVGRLVIQLAVTGGLLLLWTSKTATNPTDG